MFAAQLAHADWSVGDQSLKSFKLENTQGGRMEDRIREAVTEQAARVETTYRFARLHGDDTDTTRGFDNSRYSQSAPFGLTPEAYSNSSYVIQSAPFLIKTDPEDASIVSDLGSAVLSSLGRLTMNSVSPQLRTLDQPAPGEMPTARSSIHGIFRTATGSRGEIGCLVGMDDSALCMFRIYFGALVKRSDAPVYEGMSRGMR